MKIYLYKLKISQKLLLCSLVFLLPITVLLYFMVTEQNRTLEFTRREIEGTRMLLPLLQLMEHLPEHQRLSYFYLDGNKSLKKSMDERAASIYTTFERLLELADRYSEDLRIDNKQLESESLIDIAPSVLSESWSHLHSVTETLAPEGCNRRHARLIDQVRKLIIRIGNTSNLIMDTDLDSHYLMEIALQRMPAAMMRYGDVMLFGQQVLTWGGFSADDQARFAVYTSQLRESDRDRILQSLAIAQEQDPLFYGESPTLKKNIPPLLTEYVGKCQQFLRMLQRLATDFRASSMSAENFIETGQAARSSTAALLQAITDELLVMLETRKTHFEYRRLNALVLSFMMLAVAAVLVFLISVSITRPLAQITSIARKIASGNVLQARTDLERAAGSSEGIRSATGNKDEILVLFQSMHAMTAGLHALLVQVRRSGEQVTSAASRIAASVVQLEATVAQQVSATIETSATSKQISATSHDLASTMTEVSHKASEAAELAGSGYEGIGDIQVTMNSLLDAAKDIADKLSIIHAKADDIQQIISTITKVADQTNMLSLNASIEADKAGEHGLGFSVVAREIRRLADQTAVATMDIESIVQKMVVSVDEGVTAMRKFSDRTDKSVHKTKSIGSDLSEIIEQIRVVGPLFDSVDQGMHMQSQGAEQISQSMEQLNEAAHHTKDSLLDFKKITEELNKAVTAMQDEVKRFRLTDE